MAAELSTRALNIQANDWRTDPGPEAFERFYRLITERDEVPAIPEVAHRLMAIINKETTTIRDLVTLITRDPSLAARVLRLANSAFFALPRPVTDLAQAVTLLGFGTVRDLVMSLSLWGSIGDSDPDSQKRRKALWVHCAGVGVISKLLAKSIGRIDPGEALSAGLLHDFGKLLLGLRLGDTYWQMLNEVKEDGSESAALEQDTFGIHHGTIGQFMLQMWALPQPLCDAVANHHDPLVGAAPVGIHHVVNAANRLADLLDPQHDEAASALVVTLSPDRLTADMWPALRDEVEVEHRQIAGLFENS